ncbi:MAG: cyclophilin-like fold protein [Planctomycetota bacterium]|jgi:hypothetical protein
MPKRITIKVGDLTLTAELNDSPCAAAIYKVMPIEAAANTWGEEVYFDIGVEFGLADDAREDMDVGEIGYWPSGNAFCIFFGRTPASGPNGKPRAASAVNPVGRVLGDAKALASVRSGRKVTLTPAQ